MSQVEAVPATPTRRAIREAERAAARAAAPATAADDAPPAVPAVAGSGAAAVEPASSRATTAVLDRPRTGAELYRGSRRATDADGPRQATKVDPAGRALRVGTDVPVPDHELAAPGASSDATPGAGRWLPRAAVLGALGAVTIAVPLTGGASAVGTATPAVTASPVALPLAQPTVVDTLTDGADDIHAADDLTADPSAATRAMTVASRAHLREAVECPVQSEANGTLSAVMGGEEVEHVVMPVVDGAYRITSRFGFRTFPIYGMHEGTDFAGSLGTPLRAVADGVVTYAGGPRDGRTGNIVVIRSKVDGEVVDFWFGHMYASGVHVSVGQEVSAGQVIGEIGNAGRSTGPHLHFEVHPGGGDPTDPLAWLARHDAESTPGPACDA